MNDKESRLENGNAKYEEKNACFVSFPERPSGLGTRKKFGAIPDIMRCTPYPEISLLDNTLWVYVYSGAGMRGICVSIMSVCGYLGRFARDIYKHDILYYKHSGSQGCVRVVLLERL